MIIIYFLFAFHWSIWLYTSFYGLLRRTKNFDWFYFGVITCVLYGWLLHRNECIISLIEKKINDCSYKKGSNPAFHPSLLMYDNSIFSFVLLLFFTILQIINFLIVANDYIKNKLLLFVIAYASLALSMLYFFKYLNKNLSERYKIFQTTK
jgi:hypothetical protein